MGIDVEPSSGGKNIETYFRGEEINRLLEYFDTNAKDCGGVLPGVRFL